MEALTVSSAICSFTSAFSHPDYASSSARPRTRWALDFPGARASSPRAVRGRRDILAMAHRRAKVPHFEGGEIVRSIDFPPAGWKPALPGSRRTEPEPCAQSGQPLGDCGPGRGREVTLPTRRKQPVDAGEPFARKCLVVKPVRWSAGYADQPSNGVGSVPPVNFLGGYSMSPMARSFPC